MRECVQGESGPSPSGEGLIVLLLAFLFLLEKMGFSHCPRGAFESDDLCPAFPCSDLHCPQCPGVAFAS